MWLFSGAPEDPEDGAVMEKHGADALYSAVKSLKHAMKTEDEETQQNAVHWMIQIAKPWMRRRWSESTITNGKLFITIPKANAHLLDVVFTDDEDTKLKVRVQRYTSRGTAGARRVHLCRLACCSLVLEETEDWNNVSWQSYSQWPLDPWVDSPIIQWLRETFLATLLMEHAEYPKPDDADASRQVLLPENERHEDALPSAPPPQKAVLFCPVPGWVCHLKWCLTKYFADHVDIFHMYAEMGNDESKEMQLKLHDSRNPSVFITAPKVGATGRNHSAAYHAVITQKLSVLNKHWQAFA